MTTENDGVCNRFKLQSGMAVAVEPPRRARRSGLPDPRGENNRPSDWLKFDPTQLEINHPERYQAVCDRLYDGQLDPTRLLGLTQDELAKAFAKGRIPSAYNSPEAFADWLQTVPLIPDEE